MALKIHNASTGNHCNQTFFNNKKKKSNFYIAFTNQVIAFLKSIAKQRTLWNITMLLGNLMRKLFYKVVILYDAIFRKKVSIKVPNS